MARHALLAFVLSTSVLTLALGAQNPQTNTTPVARLLMGAVVDALDGRPVADARVTLGGSVAGVNPTEVLTDAEGRFVFMNLPRGSFTITATKPGFTQGAFGRRRPGGTLQPIVLADERISDLRIPIWKNAVITGRVTDEAGEPLIGTSVSALQRTIIAGKRKLSLIASARTDDRGLYRISSLPPGDYVVVIVSTQTSAPISVVDMYQQRLRAGDLSASDFLREMAFAGVERTMNLFERFTDARAGSFAHLQSGGGTRSSVAPDASPDGRRYIYPTQFYPAAISAADAGVTTVASGEERSGIDIQLRLTASARVSGTVAGPNGPQIASLTLMPDSDDFATDAGFESAVTLSDAAGRFTFIGVPPGRYQLRAVWLQVPATGGSRGVAPPPPKPGAPPVSALGGFTYWAQQPITVGANDVNELSVTLRPGFRLSGHTEFVGTAAQPDAAAIRRISVTIDSADGRPFVSSIIGRGQVDEKGQLSTYQLPPGRYYLRVDNAPPAWTLKSAALGNRDLSNMPFLLDRDLTGITFSFTDRPASLSGQVNTPQSQADSSAIVLVFPADAAAWVDTGVFPRRLRSIRVDREGRYAASGLPPGEYHVVAIADESSANWQDPAVLQTLARSATRLTIGDGESRTLALTTTVVRR